MVKDTTIPSFLIPQDGESINLTIAQTNALLEDQGYTYNQVGFTYNQPGVDYGGIYNTNQDEVPMTLTFRDIYTNNTPPPPDFYSSVGPGWFMFVTYKTQ